MGMYDAFRMPNIVFPDGKCYAEEFQTKDFGCNLTEYHITSDGRVVAKEYEDDKFYKPTNLTGTGMLYGPGSIDVKAVFAHGRLISLEMEE